MLPDMTEHPCQVLKVTADDAVFATAVDVPAGVQLVAYIDEVGRVEGVIEKSVSGGFSVIFNHSESRRQRIKKRLEWLDSDDRPSGAELRRHARSEPQDNKSHITLPDGRVYPCEVIDISLSGASVRTDVMPALGTYLHLGKMRGRTVRYHDEGFAIEFVSAAPAVAAI